MLAFLAQLTLVLAGVSEGRAGLGYASHVDAGGTATHYSHDEAVCAACQAGIPAASRHSVMASPRKCRWVLALVRCRQWLNRL